MRSRSERLIPAVGWLCLGGWIASVHKPWSPIERGDRGVLAVFVALGALAIVSMGAERRKTAIALLGGGSSRTFAWLISTVAAALTWRMTKDALGDHGFSIDGSIYVFEARALSHGHFGAALRTPFQFFGLRFSFEGVDGRLYGVFPPGWPLFLAPFVKLGLLRWQGPVVAFALSMAQWRLGRAVIDASPSVDRRFDEAALRVSLVAVLLALPRTILTADTMSHAFVAVWICLALATVIDLASAPSVPSPGRAVGSGLLLGVAVGWSFSARLLDGLVLGAAVFLGLVLTPARRRLGARGFASVLLGAAPFVALLLASQHAATGDAFVPTQSEYFARSDWPPSCHRLGFGPDVGCFVEHRDVREQMPNGYGLREASLVVQSRAVQFSFDTFGQLTVALLPFLAVLLRPSWVDAGLSGFVLLFSAAYGLFYYGNAPIFGARHLFPLAPIAMLLAMRALLVPTRGKASLGVPRLMLATTALATIVVTQARRWDDDWPRTRQFYGAKVDPRRVIAEHDVREGIVRTHDGLEAAAAYDPEIDSARRLVVLDDYSGLSEIRRTMPDLPVLIVNADHRIGRFPVAPPTPTQLLVELEREWPAFVRMENVGARVENRKELAPSGERVLHVLVAQAGARIAMPFEVGVGGRFAVRVDGLGGPDHGNWSLSLDGHALPPYRGYSAQPTKLRGRTSEPLTLAAGRHVLVAKLDGHDAASSGDLADFDALIGTPAP
jgi:hypothetical protein